jgi:hypothetical protein
MPLPYRREDARRRRQAERARGRFAGPFVFLDFDGVLNHAAWFKTRRERRKPDDWRWDDLSFDRVCVERLNRLLAQTAARVVVSSSWRYGDVRGGRVVCKTPQWLESLLRRHGFNGLVLDVTPILGGMRGGEIRAWLDARAEPGAAFVILDDEDYAQLDGRLVQTDFTAGGLLDVHVDLAIRMLGGWASKADITEASCVRPDPAKEAAVLKAIDNASAFLDAIMGARTRMPLVAMASPDIQRVLWAARLRGDKAAIEHMAPSVVGGLAFPVKAQLARHAPLLDHSALSLGTAQRWDDPPSGDPLADIRRGVAADQGPTNRLEAIQAGVVERMLHDVEVTLGRVTPGPNWQAALEQGRGTLGSDLPHETLDAIQAQHTALPLYAILTLRWEDLSAPTYQPTVDPVAGAIVRPARMPPDSLADVLAAKQCGDCGKGVVEAYGSHPKGLGSFVVCEAGCGWWLGAQDPDMKEPAPLTPDEREATLANYQARRNAQKRNV